MPVRAHQLYGNTVISADLRCKCLDKQYYQCYDPTQYVRRMQTCDDIQELSAACASQRDAAVPDALEPFILQHHECNTQEGCQCDQVAVLRHLPVFKSLQRHLH